MNTQKQLIAFLLLLTCVFPNLNAASSITTEATLSRLMQSIAEKDYDDFMINSTPEFKASITKQAFDAVAGQLSELISNGYSSEYLTSLNQQGYTVHLWKISYDTSEENHLARLVLDDKAVAGFWLQ